ncbi:MAG: redox-regulated ATPase YchF [bacterium]|nr:MAG: redox-regulated ATPase YchF [bacterium]
MKIGLAGYSGSGVTTLLALFSEDVGLREKHSGPGMRSIKLQDPRLESIARIYGSRKSTPVHLDIIELGDLRPEEGGGLRRETVARAAGLDALAVVLRGFSAPLAAQCRKGLDLEEELSSLNVEFCLTDLIPVENRLARLAKEGKLSSPEGKLLDRVRGQLEDGMPVRGMELTREEARNLSGYQFLTHFPLFVLANVGEEGIPGVCYPELVEKCATERIGYLEMAGQVELELLELPEEERGPFLEDLGLRSSSRDRFVSGVFDLLDLVTFFTANEREVRGWAIPRNTAAVVAAGKIHSDMERGFIRAEVLTYEDCVELGGHAAARESGRPRVEGKDYQVQDGDILQIRFNV